MKTTKQLLEERAELLAQAESVFSLAETEKRELKPEESAEVDRIMGKGESGKDGFVPGEVAKIDDLIAAQKKRDEIKASLATRTAQDDPPPSIKVKNPLNLQRHGTLKGYENREEAFRAGCWFAANILQHVKAEQYCRDMGIQQALSTGTGGGNFIIPEEMERAIIRLVEDYGVFRRNCRTAPMTSDTLLIPRRTAGVTSYYVSDVPSSITESSPTVGQAQLVAKVLAVRTLLSRDLIEDAIIDVINWVTTEIALAFATAEDQAGFLGDGTSTYGGIVGCKNALAAGSKYTAITGNTAFSTLDLADFEAMVGQVKTYALPTAKWYISQVGFWQSMGRLLDAAGGNTMQNLGQGPVFQFLGFPVAISQVLNSTTGAQTSTEGLCYFGSLSMAATLGNRRGMETQILRELYAATRQVGIITTQRFDINVHERGTSTTGDAGPLVMLVTPGS